MRVSVDVWHCAVYFWWAFEAGQVLFERVKCGLKGRNGMKTYGIAFHLTIVFWTVTSLLIGAANIFLRDGSTKVTQAMGDYERCIYNT